MTDAANHLQTDGGRMGEVITSDGVTLRYLEAGSGAPLVMVPGWSQTAAQFKHQLAGLSDRYRVIALDLRGHGESDRPDHGYRVARLAKDLHDALVGLNLTGVNLLSHSMGCSVVWCYWDLFGSERLAKLIFVDQSPFLTANPSWSESERHAAETALDAARRRDPISLYDVQNLIQGVAGLTGSDGEAITRQFIGGMFTGRISDEEKAWVFDNVLKLPRSYAARLVYNHATQDWFDVIPRIDVPTLLIGARASQIPWRSIVWMHDQIPGSRLEIFEEAEGGKHFLFMENPEKFNRLVADFIG
jgi:non-heme chloroperoxidase